jgi:hypothetical protein
MRSRVAASRVAPCGRFGGPPLGQDERLDDFLTGPHRLRTEFGQDTDHTPLPAAYLQYIRSLCIVDRSKEARVANRNYLMLTGLFIVALAACEPGNEEVSGPTYAVQSSQEECQASEVPNTTQPTCTLDAIWVYAPPGNVPAPWNPPPPPPETFFPPYSDPGGTGFNPITRPSTDTEAEPPMIGGEYADGPIVWVLCVAAVATLGTAVQTPALISAGQNAFLAVDRLNRAEANFQLAVTNGFGEELTTYFEQVRNNRQIEYHLAKENMKDVISQTKAVSLLSVSLGIIACTRGPWLPYL